MKPTQVTVTLETGDLLTEIDLLRMQLASTRSEAGRVRSLVPATAAIIAELRKSFYNDGAEGESVHALCDLHEALQATACRKPAMAHVEQISKNLQVIELTRREAGELAATLARRLGGSTYDAYSLLTQDGMRISIGVLNSTAQESP